MNSVKDFPINTREKWGLLAGSAGILINSAIFVLELTAGRMTGSTTLTADSFHNSVDAVSSIITVAAFQIAGKPADRKHPFGFGRTEYLSSLFIGLIMLGIGGFFAKTSFLKILNPVSVSFSKVAFVLMLISIPLKLLYSYVSGKYARRVSSQTLTAASLDAIGDVLIISGASFSLLFTKFTGIPVDGPLGLLVSAFILYSGFSVVKRAVSSLIGKDTDPEISNLISKTVLKAKYVVGLHDLTVHDYGPEKIMASVHAEVPFSIPLVKVHDALMAAELDLRNRGVELVIHIDPVAIRAE